MVIRARFHKAARAASLCGLLAGISAAPQLWALGLGELQMRSFLNEPLSAELELLDLRDLTADDIRIRLAGVDDFDRLGIERSYFLTSIQFDIEVDRATGRGVIRLSTQEPVLEPFLDLVVEARWPTGRLLREYTVLVDPPAFRQELVTVSATEEVARTERAAADEDAATRDSGATGAETQRTGDTVRRLESDLPPGAMPSRPFSAETSAEPRAGSRYMVKRDETLWEIASDARPSGVAVQQAMLDIQRLNPEAFIDGNINRIKAGYIIYLPAAGDISSDDLSQALEEVRQQNQDYAASRPAPGVTAAAMLRVSAEPAGAQDEAAAPTPVTDTPASGGSTAAEAVADSGAAAAPPATGSAATSEASGAPADSGASAELAAQLSAMAERLDTLEQVVALKDEQIAALEQALREAREAAAQPSAAAPAPQAAAPRPAAAPAAGIPWLPLGGGVLVLVALVALLLLRRRRDSAPQESSGVRAGAIRAEKEDDVFAGVSLKKEALDSDDDTLETFAEEEAEDAEELPSSGGSRGYGERKHDDYIDEGAAGDALAEADIYIAYGRYLQAIELLNTAIEEEPDNSAYRLKLIELYVDMGEESDAAAQLEQLRAGGDADAIARGEALVGGGGGAAPAAAPPAEMSLQDELIAPTPVNAQHEDEATIPEAPMAAPADSSDGAELALELEPTDAEPVDEDSDELVGDLEFEGLQIEEDEGNTAEGGVLEFELPTAEEELDLSDALLDLPDEEGDDAAAADEEDAGDAEEETNGDFVIAEDSDQMATKLDLARAYLDMGDGDGARVILEEVLAGGSDEQQQEARELLSRVD